MSNDSPDTMNSYPSEHSCALLAEALERETELRKQVAEALLAGAADTEQPKGTNE